MKLVKKMYKTYSFFELSEEAKENAREVERGGYLEGWDWYEGVYEQYQTLLSILGFDVDRMYFSGFSSQGDGACFTGDYLYKKQSVSKVKTEYPAWTDAHIWADRLYKLQKNFFYSISCKIRHSGHYYHELCTSFSLEILPGGYEVINETLYQDTEEDLKTIFREIMQNLYLSLEEAYYYLLSDENIDEGLQQKTFLDTGEVFYDG